MDICEYIKTKKRIDVPRVAPYVYSYGQGFSLYYPAGIHKYLKIVQEYIVKKNNLKMSIGDIINEIMFAYMNNDICDDIDFLKTPREEIDWMVFDTGVQVRPYPNKIKNMWSEITEMIVVDLQVYDQKKISKIRNRLIASVIDYIYCNGPDPIHIIVKDDNNKK